MLKIKSILVSLLAVAALASCSNENLEENPEVEGGAGYDVAYVSISLTNPKVPGSRASGEQTALEEESAINIKISQFKVTLHFVTTIPRTSVIIGSHRNSSTRNP
jgi:hypothetical protein